MQRRLPTRRSTMTTIVLAAAATAVALGATVIAQSDEDTTPVPPPGTPISGDADAWMDSVIIGGDDFDPTILTKFLPGHAFNPHQGAGVFADIAAYDNAGSCIAASPASGGGVDLELRAGLELPDGARNKQLTFFGTNSDVSEAIVVRLLKTTINVPIAVGGPVTETDLAMDSFTVPAGSGVVAVSGRDDLMERVGSRATTVPAGTDHQFHSIRVRLKNSAGTNHKLCGVEVAYQVPTLADSGSVFYPLAGYRAYDSRLDMGPVAAGPLSEGANRVIPVKDGRDIGTGVINLANAIPANATAITFTVAAASPTNSGFLFIGPGDAAGVTASTLNWGANTSGAIANSGTVKLDASRQIKAFVGGPGTSTHFIIDVTGYYAPGEHPNMGN